MSTNNHGWVAIANDHHAIRKHDWPAWLLLMEFYARVRGFPATVHVSNGPVDLECGQCVFGYREIAVATRLTVGEVRCAVVRLHERYKSIALRPTHAGTIVTVLFAQEFKSPSRRDTRDGTPPARREPLTKTEDREDAACASISFSTRADGVEPSVDADVIKLHARQEVLRREVIGAGYFAIPLRAVRPLIEQQRDPSATPG
jgi:hypothetical protein